MNPHRAARAFLRAPAGKRRLALEALAELARARLVTLMPARVYTADLGVLAAAPAEEAEAAGAADCERAAEIGRVVAAVAGAVPFRALCLQQAIAVRRMLRRRGIPATVHLGFSRGLRQAVEGRADLAAHAWVTVGRRVVNGDANLDDYTVVARFN